MTYVVSNETLPSGRRLAELRAEGLDVSVSVEKTAKGRNARVRAHGIFVTARDAETVAAMLREAAEIADGYDSEPS
jgi:hypothetical protein